MLHNQCLAKSTFHLDQPTRVFPVGCLQYHSWGIAHALNSLLQLNQAAVNVVHIFLGDLGVDVWLWMSVHAGGGMAAQILIKWWLPNSRSDLIW